MNYEKIKEDFERDGVVKIEGVFTQEEVNKIKAAGIDSLTRMPWANTGRVRYQSKERDNVRFPALSFWPAITTSYLNKIRTDDRIAGLMKYLLGDEIKQLNNQFYFRMPGDGDEFAWHTDVFFRDDKELFPDIESNYIQTGIVLDEITENSGAVEYVLGSHKEIEKHAKILTEEFGLTHTKDAPEKLRKFVRGSYKGEKMTAKPGDLVIWSVAIVHGSESNKTNNSRMVYMNGFAASKASKHFPRYMIKGFTIDDINIAEFPEHANTIGK